MYRNISEAFSELINRQNLTSQQKETATSRIATINNFLQKEFYLSEAPFVTGSYARGTLCAGERDIDIMCPFEPYGQANYWSRYKENSKTFLYWVRDNLNERYATTKVSSKQVAVTLDFNFIKVDLVPCFPRDRGGYLLPDGLSGWNETNPKYHTQLILKRDSELSQKLKPLIKLAKTWNNANGHHLQSFHLEMMIEKMWRNATYIPTWANGFKQTLATLPRWLNTNFMDPWDSSNQIDLYITRATQQQLIRMLEEDSDRAENAMYYESVNNVDEAFRQWGIIFRDVFPSRFF